MKRFAWLVVPAILSACAAGPQLEKYPRAAIDRPYTLPKGVASWDTLLLVGHQSDNTSSFTIPPIPIPLFWNTSLSDTWTLHWSPLPLSASHQFFQTGEHLLGITFGSGFGYSSGSSGFAVAPALEIHHRWTVTDGFAWRTTPTFNGIFYTGGRSSRWAVGLELGPLFQLSETFALLVTLEPRYQKGYDFQVVEGTTLFNSTAETMTLPISAGFIWSAGRQWDIQTQYTYAHFGYQNNYTGHVGTIWFKHYW